MTSQLHRVWTCSLLVALACNIEHTYKKPTTGDNAAVPLDDSVDERPVVNAVEPPPPITGGTLLVTKDGAFAVASDPDRSLVHVVDLAQGKETATIGLEHRARPFRAAEDAAGMVHITLRGTGQVVTIDPIAGQIVSGPRKVCQNPRGITYHEVREAMIVACAGGDVVEITADGSVAKTPVTPDLRDVFVIDGRTYVSRFRAADVLEVELGVGITGVAEAPISPNVTGILRVPTTAWRTFYTGPEDNSWVMLHQLATTTPLPAPTPRENPLEEEPGFETSGGFGSGSGDGGEGGYAGTTPCGGATNPALTMREPGGTIKGVGPFLAMAVAVDAAISPTSSSIVVASPSQHDEFRKSTERVSLSRWRIPLFDSGALRDCRFPEETIAVGDFVAVAFTPDGDVLAQTRANPQLHRIRGMETVGVIDLVGDDVVDTGHELFHLDTGSGLACVSCHPEGSDDGRVWSFTSHGPRRTQALDAGIRDTQPFHWGGDMLDMPMLANEVRHRRMGGAVLSGERLAALQEWIFAIPQPNQEITGDDEGVAAAAGAQRFIDLGCRTCHAGPAYTNNATVPFVGEHLQVPNLRSIALRPPYMHDGRCETLECAVTEMAKLTPGGVISDEDRTSLIAYLKTL